MSKSIKIYIAILILILIGIVFLDARKPKPVDWSPTMIVKDKIPFGMYVFDQEIGKLLKQQNIEKIDITLYEYFDQLYDTIGKEYDEKGKQIYPIQGTVLNIAPTSDIDKESADELLKFVKQGNTAFISAESFPELLLDSLKIELKVEDKFKDTIQNWVANKKLGDQKYKFLQGVGNVYFSKIDTLKSTALGYQDGDSTRVNFLKVQCNSGTVYLHTQPVAFTNFHLLKDNNFEYAQKVLSYVPEGDIFWYVKNQTGTEIDDSSLYYIRSQPALKYAGSIFLIGMLVFMIFNAKRKQRIVPIIEPLTNTTIDFTKTIGNLYHQEGNHDNIINKIIIYFLEKVRTDYLIDTSTLDEEFIKKLHQKSGKDLQDIQKVVFLIKDFRRSAHSSIADDLIKINAAIEKVV